MKFLTTPYEVSPVILRILFLILLFRPIMDKVFPPVKSLSSMSLDSVILFAITIVLIIQIRKKKYYRKVSKPLLMAMGLNLLIMIIASFQTYRFQDAGRMIFVQLSFYSIYIVLTNIKLKFNIIKVFNAIVYSSFIPLLFVLYELSSNSGYRYQFGNTHLRTSSIFEGAYVLGIYLAFIGIAAVFMTLYTRKKKYVAFSLMITLGIVTSGSRSSLIILFLGVLILVTEFRQMKRIIMITIFSVFMIMITRTLYPETYERFSWVLSPDYYSEANEASTANVRLSWWYLVWPLIEEKPLIGWGLTNQTTLTFNYYGVRDVSSGLLVRLIEGGVLLIFSLFIPLLLIIKSAQKRKTRILNKDIIVNKLFYSVTVMITLAMVMETILLHGVKGIYPWSILGLSMALVNMKHTPTRVEVSPTPRISPSL